jgi:CheY-like chemotaxis protein
VSRQPQSTQQNGGVSSPVILVVDDVALNRAVLVEILSVAGYRVVQSSNGRDALEQIRLFHPVLVLMDIEMPVMDGLAAVRELRQNPEFRDLPVVAVTARTAEQDRKAALEAGFSAYILKPCALSDLLEAMGELLHSGAGADENGGQA